MDKQRDDKRHSAGEADASPHPGATAISDGTLTVLVQRLALGHGDAARTLIEGLHIQVPPGAIHTVMGPSGCGKSSLLAAIGSCLPESFTLDARFYIGKFAIENIPMHLRGVGMLFQDDLLFPHLTVLENLLLGVPRGPKADRIQQAQQALHEVDLAGCAQHDPATLSGGQRARVALMRALLARPRALLLDEPFSKLDAELRAKVRALVFDTVRQRGIPALLVTHDAGDVADVNRVTRLA